MKYVVGLTGQSGAGKTTVAELFASMKYEIIDADKIGRALTEDESVLTELSTTFGPEFVPNGVLDRKHLGTLVFSNKKALAKLNGIMFPKIASKIQERIATSTQKFILLDAPQLFESGAQNLCNCIVSVVAPKEILVERICQRDGITEKDAINRLASQFPREFFEVNSDFVIVNDGDLAKLTKNTKEIYAIIHAVAPQTCVDK